MGDFNAKIGQSTAEDLSCMGPYGYGERDPRGKILVDFCQENQLYIMNTQFKEKSKRRWTGNHLMKVCNEIDFIITKKAKIGAFENVEVINTSYPTDHRLVRATYSIRHTQKKKTRRNFKKENIGFNELEKESLKNIFVESITSKSFVNV